MILGSWVVSFRILISEIPKSSVSDGIHGSFIAPGYHVAGTLLFVNSVAVERFNSGASKQLVSQTRLVTDFWADVLSNPHHFEWQ